MENNIRHLEQFNFKHSSSFKLENHLRKNTTSVYHKGDFLFMADDPCQEILLIEKGKVKIAQYNEKGEEQIIAFRRKGALLGYMALLGEKRHHTFAEVVEDGTQVVKMKVAKARELSLNHLPFALEINRHISNHIFKLENRIEILLCKNVRIRLLKFLDNLAAEYGRSRDGGIWISHSLTQSDIAALIGTSRKSASLLLNELATGGLIEFDRRHIFIFDTCKLKKMAMRQERISA